MRGFIRRLGPLVATLLIVSPTPSSACVALAIDANGHQYVTSIGGAPPPPPIITGEQAVIIWDEAHKTEHFLRQADISTTQPNVGFVVPTPQTPELVEADPQIFDLAGEEAAPRRVPRTLPRTPMEMIIAWIQDPLNIKSVFTTIASTLDVAASGPNDVQVISQQDVADYHATVLAADDSASLSQWLKENGYAWDNKDDAWLQPYLTAKWKITAFKLLQKPNEVGTGTIQSRAIRMSFTTDRPFFPYSEPGDTPSGGKPNPGERVLNVAVLSDERMTGKLADGHVWPGELQYSGPMDTLLTGFANFDPKKDAVPAPTNLTYFVDNSNPRPGTADLYFSPDTDQTAFRKIVVDPDLPPNYRMDWSHPFADIEALLIICVPILGILGLARLMHRTQRPRTTG